LASEGSRKSPSINSTFVPGAAAADARFQETVVFPSPAEPEVMRTERMPPFGPM
jgi:hypothetical protein